MSDDIRSAVQGLIADILKRKRVEMKAEDIKEGVSLTRDLGIDSLDILQLSATVEKRYGLRFAEAEIRAMDDLGGILAAIARHRKGPASTDAPSGAP